MTIANIVNRLTCRDAEQWQRSCAVLDELRQRIPGWSVPLHHAFFESVFVGRKDGASVLVCGVYRGLDLAIMERAGLGRSANVIGVDLFSSEPCSDWTDEQRVKGSWEAAGMGLPPSMEAAQAVAPWANLVRSSSVDYMRTTDERFDFIYLDTSHDEKTVTDEIIAARSILKEDGILAGDDYAGPEGWGVRAACEKLLPYHVAISNRIWISAL